MNHIYENSSQSRSRQLNNSSNRKHRNGGLGTSNISMYPISHVETRVDAQGNVSTSQERIVESTVSRAGTLESGEDVHDFQHKNGAITRTVEFEFHDSIA
jgi:hypothetical protein